MSSRHHMSITREITASEIADAIKDMGMDGADFLVGILAETGPSAYHAAAAFIAENPDETDPCESCQRGRKWRSTKTAFTCDLCGR